jgi:TolA-binding protein
LVLKASGNVGINTSSPGYTLDVAGQVHAASFVASSGNNYADFVFKPGYKLEPLSAVEASIQKDGHLPGIPSEAEAKAHGIDLASMQVKLLQKIEELTLHQIDEEKHQIEQEKHQVEQQKLLENQTERLDDQSKRIEQLEQENTELRAALNHIHIKQPLTHANGR